MIDDASLEELEFYLETGNIQAVDRFFQQNLFSKDEINRFLYVMAECGSVELAEYLVKKGAELSSEWGNSALSHAVMLDHFDLCRFFISHGVDIHYRQDIILTEAVWKSKIEIIDELLKAGTSPYKRDYMAILTAAHCERQDVVELILRYYIDFPPEVMLLVYTNLGDIPKVQDLIQNGANIHYKDNIALKDAIKQKHFEIAEILINAGADTNLIFERSITENDPDIVKFLIAKNFPFNEILLFQGYVILGNIEMVENIVRNGVDIHSNGDIALKLARINEQHEMVKFLLDNGVDRYS